MSQHQMPQLRTLITALVTLLIWTLLAWEHLHGGVASHHLLHRPDLPSISNWWGGLLLPVLTWILLGRVTKRSQLDHDGSREAPMYPSGAVAGFSGSLLFGILLSTAFTLDYPAVSSFMFQGLFLLALFLPIYRAECMLGFVLGMTFTFGAVLPIIVGTPVVLIALGIYRYLRPILLRAISLIAPPRSSASG